MNENKVDTSKREESSKNESGRIESVQKGSENIQQNREKVSEIGRQDREPSETVLNEGKQEQSQGGRKAG